VLVDELPPPGATVAGTGYLTAAGGKGLNQAVAAARQGATVAMVGAVGDDAAGGLLAGVLADEGILTSGLRRVEGASGTALITVSASGDNTIVVAAGANAALDPSSVTAAVVAGAAVVLCQLEVPLATVRTALRLGRAAGALTVLNPSPARTPLPADVLALVDIIVPNETEAGALTGLSAGCDGGGAAAAALVAGGAGTAIVTLGRHGARLTGAGPSLLVPALRVEAVDPTAAGDAFIGALVAALATGETVAWAVRRATAAGAIAVTRRGAVPSLPQRHEVDHLLAASVPTDAESRRAGPVSPAGSRPRSRSAGAQPAGPRRPPPSGGRGAGPGGRPRPGGSRS
jgi:ribokinase